ncbi:MAG: tRNA (adenosine(37)-N6)-threonylcarbamoyltransferase complex dimerization subunit type 1 TsaB, partial [Methylorubrum rhodinum]|uniref:tRNA (adenosine(37)-N6)-threonylcarbamoyltransferase complex dimerization subunit type 1 TsaB n=1 Tax=Methylorubrum rhodinum TaxID=29428 RepID=UPI003BB02D0C
MRILAIDTALDACAACIATDASDDLLAEESMPLARGHAEALLPLIERVMARVDGGFASLSRVAVTVGPGSYTGLRVGLSAARAVGLATGIPVVGVTTLSALLAPQLALDGASLIAAAIDARHGAVYLQAMSVTDGVVIPPQHVSLADAVALLGRRRTLLTG